MGVFKKLIEWTEGEIRRGRKIALFSTIFSFLVITFFILAFFVIGFGQRLEGFYAYYATLAGLAASAIAFYTSTKATDTINKITDTIEKEIQNDK